GGSCWACHAGLPSGSPRCAAPPARRPSGPGKDRRCGVRRGCDGRLRCPIRGLASDISEVINNSLHLSRNDSQVPRFGGKNGAAARVWHEKLSELAFLPAIGSSQKRSFQPYSVPTTRMSD